MSHYTPIERKIDIFCLILFPLIFITLAILAHYEYSPAYFSGSYVMMTEVVSAIIVTILPLLRVMRKFHSPYWFMIMITTVPMLHSASLFFGFYQSFEYWDIIAHSYSSLVVGLIIFVALLIISNYTTRISLGSTKTILILTFLMAWGFGNVWEIQEWVIDNIFGNAFMSYSVLDTLKDLIVSDFIGAVVLEIIAWIILRYHTINDIVDSMDLDDFMKAAGKKWDKLTTPGYNGKYLRRDRTNEIIKGKK
jgi:hypothetical protein